jgi:hypothetical protein
MPGLLRFPGGTGASIVDIAVNIAPAAVVIACKTAGFMQAMRTSANLVSCDEFHFFMVLVEHGVAFDLQAQPACGASV